MKRLLISEFLGTAFHKCNLTPDSYFYSYRDTSLDYCSFKPLDGDRNVEIDDWFEVTITPGASEGLYLEVWMLADGASAARRYVGCVKTLDTSLTAHKDLGMLAGEFMYHLQHTKFRT